MMTWTLYAPLHRFLALLAAGWRLPFIVEPMAHNHGRYSILLERKDNPNGKDRR